MSELTSLLDRLRDGDPHAPAALFAHVYDELRRIAGRQAATGTLSPTEVVHEAYLRLFGGQRPSFADRAYFFAAAAQAMRRVRIDHARAACAAKRGGGRERVELAGVAAPAADLDLVALDEALGRLAARDAQMVKLVELRFFAGLSMRRVAEVLGVSLATAERRWAYARAWLLAELQGLGGEGGRSG